MGIGELLDAVCFLLVYEPFSSLFNDNLIAAFPKTLLCSAFDFHKLNFVVV